MISYLNNRSLVKISGKDSQQFLQSQFSNNINHLQKDRIQVNAYCQHQGKIIALIWLFRIEDEFYLSIPTEMKEILLSRLNMFKLMSDIDIEDISSVTYQYGVVGKVNLQTYKIHKNLSLLISNDSHHDSDSIDSWEKACIENYLPEIYLTTSEKYIPQALNLDLNEFGVSFSKGCYPGQEVVARMHYLGNPKRRLFIFKSRFKTNVGDSLNINESKSLKPSGEVIRSVSYGDGFLCLATFETAHIDKDIYLNNIPQQKLEVFNE